MAVVLLCGWMIGLAYVWWGGGLLADDLERRVLDGWNLLPKALLVDDPLYASAFVANLGSVGLDAAFHHLYEYGTIPIFATMGRIHRAPVVYENGSVGSREIFRMRYTYDERVEDGFYAARALERLAGCLADPSSLR